METSVFLRKEVNEGTAFIASKNGYLFLLAREKVQDSNG